MAPALGCYGKRKFVLPLLLLCRSRADLSHSQGSVCSPSLLLLCRSKPHSVPLSGRYLVNALVSVDYGLGESSTTARNSARTTWRMRAAVDLGTPGMSRTVASGFSNNASPTARLAPK